MFILVLLVLSYFPSQVPDFFKETAVINKLWDLIYLLVIGIAVSYGLFSRKADRGQGQGHSFDDNIGGNDAYLSGISHISSVFDNRYGLDVKSWGEGQGLNSRVLEKKLNQYGLGESLVVINDKKFVLEQLGRRKSVKKPNLGSKSWDSGAGKSVVEDSDSDSGVWFQENQIEKFRGLLPIKLEERFQESGSDFDADADAGSDSRTRFNRRSKSMKLEERGESRDLDFDGGKLQPVRFKNFSGKEGSSGVEVNYGYGKPYVNGEASFMEPKRQDFDGMFGNGFEDFMNDFGKVKVDDVAFDPTISKQFVKSKSQSSSTGASFETNAANNYKKGKSVRTNRSKEQVLEPIVNTFQGQTDEGRPVRTNRSKEQILESNVNTFQGQTDEGKPVRTNRSKEQVFEPKVSTFQSQTDEVKPIRTNRSKEQVLEPKVNTFQGQTDEVKPIRTSRLKEQVLESKVNTFQCQTDEGKSVRTNRSKEQFPEPKFSTFQSQTDEGKPVRTNRSKEQVLESKVNTFQSQTDDKAETSSKQGTVEMNVADELSDTEPHSGEVDRKAEEFIAKFREQIRLQKVASARKLNMMDYN